MKITTILGARPQFIKAATVSRLLLDYDGISEIIIHTGQHFDDKMSKVFFEQLDIPLPLYNLGISGISHGAMTGRMLEKIEDFLIKEKPDIILVYGDTNSTLAGALAGAKLQIPVAHVEAGLRSFNNDMPEEINRILTDRTSKLLFCPTENAIKNLRKEGFDNFDCKYFNVGDVMFDSVRYYLKDIKNKSIKTEPYALLTLHRQENTDNTIKLKSIVNALNSLSEQFRIIFPVHPRTYHALKSCGLKLNVETIEPVGYIDMIDLINNSDLIITDSGGLQKEAYFLGKYCITLREETEWIELVDADVNSLVGANEEMIIENFHSHFGETVDSNRGFYGNAKAAERICSIIAAYK